VRARSRRATATALLAALAALVPAGTASAATSPSPSSSASVSPSASPSASAAVSAPESPAESPSATPSATATAATEVGGARPTSVLYVVLPHPDDEFEVWSQVQDTPDVYKVFVLLTHGEESANCLPTMPGYDPAVEPAPSPLPLGLWTTTCEEARLNSWRDFLSDMSDTDPSVPGTFRDRGRVERLASRSAPVCRRDADTSTCARRDRGARLWTDTAGHGSLVVFDLGDRDLTSQEVVWAMRTVRDNPTKLGIDPSLPSRGVVGSYANTDHAGCFTYGHPDHLAVSEALIGTDLGLGPQLAATAKDDPRATVTGTVSTGPLVAAFGWDGSTGAHARRYGWLWREDADALTSGRVDAYQVDREGQRRLFHVRQHFRVAFGPPPPTAV